MSGVLKAVSAIAADLAKVGIGKDKKNKEQGFFFRGIDDVLNVLSGLYAEHGLVVLPRYSDHEMVEGKTKSGTPLFRVTLKGAFTLVSPNDGSVVEAGPFYGEAMDTADKATSKAMSVVYKYFALQTFCAPVVGTPDADEDTHHPAPTEDPPAKLDVAGWIEKFNACASREALLAEWEQAKLDLVATGDVDAVEILKGARDARGKALAAAAKKAKKEPAEAAA